MFQTASNLKIATRILIGLIVLCALGAAGTWGAYEIARRHYGATLPAVSELQNIQLGEPLRIYTADGKLIGEFGAERRQPLEFDAIPKPLWRAFLAAEDSDFFHHGAVDFPGLARAALVLAATGQKKQGGSTITMQLARGLFLSPEKTYARKIKEILLAQRIEKTLDKQQILTLYLNRVFLGHRAYGVAAAAHVYYGKTVDALTLSEMATLAGLPKAPSTDNPATNPARAKIRRDYVLGRMRDLGWISQADFERALAQPVVSHLHAVQTSVDAAYAAELVRAQLVAQYGEAAYTSGMRVYTTLESKAQSAAVAAVRAGLLAYTQRHGYDGPEAQLPAELTARLSHENDPDVSAALQDYGTVGGLVPAAVVRYTPERLVVQTPEGQVTLGATAFAWAKRSLRQPLKPGAVVRLLRDGDGWKLVQVPKAQAAFVALDATDGAIRALVGGFDFYANKFNRATQAQRQLGSGFKPYLYTAALAKGYTPASTFLDAPIVAFTPDAELDPWRPRNDNGEFNGPMRMRAALMKSVNLVSIRILQNVGIGYMRDFVATRFGIPVARIPPNLTAALGTAGLTPLEQARGYAVFANGGFLIDPYIIERIQAQDGSDLFKATPAVACPTCMDTSETATLDPNAPLDVPAGSTSPAMPATARIPAPGKAGMAPRTLSRVTDYLINSLLASVISGGTGHAAAALGRHDLHGKTGTTNDYTDAWFNGYTPGLVAVAWVGFDQPASLGKGEFGAKAALPIWMAFMKRALANVPETSLPRPPGITTVLIDPKTGEQVPDGTPGAMSEIVQSDRLPPLRSAETPESAPAELLY